MDFLFYLISFIGILSVIVFIHEFGHYYVAKRCGVKIEEFAIGFGHELFGWHDSSNTRWKICLFPLGGYVKMFGDQNAASLGSKKKFTKKEKEQSFSFKPLYQRFLIVLAGPVANYLLAIAIIFILFAKYGISISSNIVNDISPDMPAATAGLQKNDKIIAIDGRKIEDFEDIRQIVQISPEMKLDFQIERDKQILSLDVTPQKQETTDYFGNKISLGLIGIRSSKVTYKELGYLEAFSLSIKESWDITTLSVKFIKELILGKRSISELGGPIKIAKYSGQVTKKSLFKDENGNRNFYLLFWFIAMISINLGFANLLPIPVLDGGHLMLYIVEFIRGKPLSIEKQELIFKLGFSFLLLLFIAISFSDIKFVLNS